jgi:hypothetical protein
VKGFWTVIFAKYLNDAASRTYVLPPKQPTYKRRQHIFLQGGEPPERLAQLKRGDIVWCMASFAQLLKEHAHIEMEVLKKYHKKGVVAVRVVNGPLIRKAAQRPTSVSLDEYYEAYQWVSDYLASYGITFSSFSWASEQAFRIQLKKPLRFSNPIGRRLLKTSRGVCVPGLYEGGLIQKWDIRGAYPFAMVANAHKFPSKLIPIHEKEWEKHNSIVLAYVYCRPSEDRVKVPVIQEHPTDTDNPTQTINWFFDFELQTIIEQGHSIQPLAAFRISTIDLSDELGAWHDLLSARYESNLGFKGKLLKGVANALWGTFSSSEMASFTWRIDSAQRIQPVEWSRSVYPGKPGGEHVAAWVNALVSDRVYNEFLLPYDVLYFDTDGGFTRGNVPETLGGGAFGSWRFEGYVNKINVVSWQAYASYTDNGIRVTLSGIPNATLADLMKHGVATERQGAIQNLMEDRTLSRVVGVNRTIDKVTVIPPEAIGGWERSWLPIESAIAPDISLFTVADDTWEVSPEQASAFRKLSNFRLDNVLPGANVDIAP